MPSMQKAEHWVRLLGFAVFQALTVGPFAIALAVTISTVAWVAMMALLFIMPMASAIVVTIIIRHNTGAERHCHGNQHQNGSFFHRFSLGLATVATVIVAMTISLMSISRPVRGTTTIIAITAVIIVSIAIVITHQTAQSATN